MAELFTRRKILKHVLSTPLLLTLAPVLANERENASLPDTLSLWIKAQRERSIGYLLRNISPTGIVERSVGAQNIAVERLDAARREAAKPGATVRFEGERFLQTVVPKPGSVLAADRGGSTEPDYAFHWVRDSSLIMREVAGLVTLGQPSHAANFRRRWEDYSQFTRALQLSPSTVGSGEVRYNLDGTQDYLQWSRPQHDGPPLRALAFMYFRAQRAAAGNPEYTARVDSVLRQDLDDIAANWNSSGFDLWEEYNGHDFHARVVRVGALRAGAHWARAVGDTTRAEFYAKTEQQLREALEDHWSQAKGYYGFHVGRKVYWDGKERAKPGDNFDAAVVTAAVHSRLTDGRYSLLDDRILASAVRAEDLFTKLYAINRGMGASHGALYGRYEGDNYFGGNPFVFITLEFAEAHYRIASLLAQRRSLAVTPLNREFLDRALRRADVLPLIDGRRDALADKAMRRALLRGLVLRGDDILRTVMRLTPESGKLPEQFNQNDGAVASSSNVSWSHSALLAATRARAAALSPRVVGANHF